MTAATMASACAGTKLGHSTQRGTPLRPAAAPSASRRRAARRADIRAQQNGTEPSAWDTLSVDELQEWEVRAAGAAAAALVVLRPCPLRVTTAAALQQQQAARVDRCLFFVSVQETGPPTPLLDTINFPVHLKNLGLSDLKKLCKELRAGGCRLWWCV